MSKDQFIYQASNVYQMPIVIWQSRLGHRSNSQLLLLKKHVPTISPLSSTLIEVLLSQALLSNLFIVIYGVLPC